VVWTGQIPKTVGKHELAALDPREPFDAPPPCTNCGEPVTGPTVSWGYCSRRCAEEDWYADEKREV